MPAARSCAKNESSKLRDAGFSARSADHDSLEGGGHNLFFTVDYYWSDVANFLKLNN